VEKIMQTTLTRKKPTNLSMNVDLLAQARLLGINLSAICEVALQQEVKRRRDAQWAEQNREGMEALNDLVARNGVFSDGLRGF